MSRTVIHNESKTRLYSIWNSMHSRCYRKLNDSYAKYGGNGITVCNDWYKDFLSFKSWSLLNGYKDTLSIDRKNNKQEYSPNNCRWVTRRDQVLTRDKMKNNTSGYIGISYRKSGNKWIGEIRVEGIRIYLGGYSTAIKAAYAREVYIIDNELTNTRNFPHIIFKNKNILNLDFLSNVKLEPVKKTVATRASVIKLPEDADIRVFANGKVFPSKAFAELAQLEFVPKAVVIEGSDPEVIGNGLDIFSSEQWGMVDLGDNKVLFCYLVPKSYAKVDIWANTKYDAATGEPKASVFTQGASTFSKAQLLGMIADVYGTDWENTEYVDMVLVVENIMPSASNMYDIPKIISGGEKKGQWTNVRRQNINVCPIVIKHTQMKGVPAGSSTETPPALGSDHDIDKTPEMQNMPIQGAPFDEKVEVPVADLDVKDPVTFDAAPAEASAVPSNTEVASTTAPVQSSVSENAEGIKEESGQIASAVNPKIPETAIPPNPLFTEPVTKAPVSPAASTGTDWAKGLGATIPKGK